jgi:hypothetical protein
MIQDYQTMLRDVQLRQATPGYNPNFAPTNECSAQGEQIGTPKDETSINTKKEQRFQALGMIFTWKKIQ